MMKFSFLEHTYERDANAVLICCSNNHHSALHAPWAFLSKQPSRGCYVTADLIKMFKFYLLCYSDQFECRPSPSIDMGAYSHLGKYTSTFCFFTELAHSLINEALTSGSNVTSGTSCLESTIIILISSPSYGISRT